MTGVADALDEVAAIAQRLAVLLAAGVTPERAWGFLGPRTLEPRAKPGERAEPAERAATPLLEERAKPAERASRKELSDAVLSAAAVTAQRAGDVAAAITAECTQTPPFGAARHRAVAWGLFAATWSVAMSSGAPPAAALQSFAAGIRRAAALHRELGVAFAGPRATARLVGLLPLVALGFGAMLGFDTVHVLAATPVGWACLGGGIALMVGARRWSGRLLAAAEPQELVPGLLPELVAVAMGSGAPVGRARQLAASALREHAPFLGGEALDADEEAVDGVLELAARAGAPTIGLLVAEAERRRADADAAGRAAAASVAVRLVVPLAVCVLPAFMLLGVVPVLVALLSGTGIHFG
ncbi:type II secretion system F family protein [Gryllotalpicola daejeonensis]|uniref:Type II secretion system F family protein n=1 Tax=Gryllotalpicola daejeonensis TaxID=993087 RepID=A0ABP7ZNL2_9MICO